MASELKTHIEEAAAYIRARTKLVPQVGIVLGTGLGDFASALQSPVVIPYRDIPHFPVSGVESHAGELHIGTLAERPVAIMKGRVHFYEGYSMQQVAFPIRVFKAIGCMTVVLTNAVGGMNPNMPAGTIVVTTDHINLMGANPLVGPNDERLGPRFPDMSEAWDRGMADLAERCCREAGATVRRGVYIGLSGPSYETPAEIRMARLLGADAVGMSTVPEAIAARHAGMRVVGISCITNHAAGVTSARLDHSEVLATGERVRGVLCDALTRLVRALSAEAGARS